MKVTWSESDIKPGRRYTRNGIKEVWIIGFMGSINGSRRYVSISMEDGMVTPPKTKAELAEMLTKEHYLPTEVAEVK